MKGEVEVTFKCEGCGKVLCVSKHNQPSDVCQNIGQTMSIGDFTCDACAEPTYGPLTVEMVAEALRAAAYPEATRDSGGCSAPSEWYSEASFVLRLLNKLPEQDINPHYKGDWTKARNVERVRDWLLDLARKP